MPLEVGQFIEGKYRIVRLIGEGGMGAVYEGENTRINRRVAIKVLHAVFANNAEVVERFELEARAAGRIGNDHILEVLDLGSLPTGAHYIVMEYLDGEALSRRIERQGRLSSRDAASLILQVLTGLSAAHGAGIVHRDLKPENIFILREKASQPDFIKIIDFGISKFQQVTSSGLTVTHAGAIMGSPYYMSPEQATGSVEADTRSDLYSVGVILYQAVTGRVPFDASSYNELLFKIALSDPPLPEGIVPDLDPAFSSIICKAMLRDPKRRFQTAREFTEALQAWVERGQAVALPPPSLDPVGLISSATRAEPSDASRALVDQLLQEGSGAASLTRNGNNKTKGSRETTGNWYTSRSVSRLRAAPYPLVVLLGLALFGLVIGAFSLIPGRRDEVSAIHGSSSPATLAESAVSTVRPSVTVAPIRSIYPSNAPPTASVHADAAVPKNTTGISPQALANPEANLLRAARVNKPQSTVRVVAKPNPPSTIDSRQDKDPPKEASSSKDRDRNLPDFGY